MAPKIDPASDAYLSQRYDELYNASADFKSRLHNVVTTSRALKLKLNPGAGHAMYDTSDNSITVWRQRILGTNKTDMEIRDDLFFELHNARTSMALATLSGSSGYNASNIANDIKKAAGYAIAVEWTEWINVAESTILVYIVNNQAGVAGPLLPTPPAYRAAFDPGADSWMKFANYLKTQVDSGHTASYDPAATGGTWKGYDILRVVVSNGRNNTDLEIVTNEIAPTAPKVPFINKRGNPFTWEIVNKLQTT